MSDIQKRKEDYRTRMRSARGPLHNALERIDNAADYDSLRDGIIAMKKAKLAVKIIQLAMKRRLGQ